jgi:hypothetical protein
VANRAFAATPADEERAWAALRNGPARRRGPLQYVLAGVGAVAAAAGVALMAAHLGAPVRQTTAQAGSRAAGPPRASGGVEALSPVSQGLAGAPSPVMPPAEAPAAPDQPHLLAPGRAPIAAGLSVRLSTRGVARLTRMPHGRARIALERGSLDVDGARSRSTPHPRRTGGAAWPPGPAGGVAVAPGVSPPAIEVDAASLRFEGTGSNFRVNVTGDDVDLAVSAGRVSVWSVQRLVARVVAGQRWSNRGRTGPSLHTTPVDGEAQPPADAPGADKQDCLLLARSGSIDEALGCFERQAAQPGLGGEIALVELSRIRRDVKGDLAGAERALAEHRRRFPAGSLAAEAAGSRVELLLRLGRPEEALAEVSRTGKLEGAYWRAMCLAKLGRREEALRALDEYLARPDGARRAEALRRRAELGTSGAR